MILISTRKEECPPETLILVFPISTSRKIASQYKTTRDEVNDVNLEWTRVEVRVQIDPQSPDQSVC